MVISARFSGTRQQSCGRTPTAMSEHLVGEAHLEIHARLQQRPQRVHVAILDVAAVFAQMQRDVVGARLLGQQRGVHRVRIRRAARLAHRGDVIDVDAQLDVRRNDSCD